MWKRTLVLVLLVGGLALCGTSKAQAWGRRRGYVVHRPVVVAPVRRVAYRHAYRPVPRPYPVVRRVVTYSHVDAYPAYPFVYGPAYPYVYGPGVSVFVGH